MQAGITRLLSLACWSLCSGPGIVIFLYSCSLVSSLYSFPKQLYFLFQLCLIVKNLTHSRSQTILFHMQIIDPVYRCLEYIIYSDFSNCSAEDYLPTGSHLQRCSPIHYHKQSRLEKNSNEADLLNMGCIWGGWIWRFPYVGKAFHHIVTCRSNTYQNLWPVVSFIIPH